MDAFADRRRADLANLEALCAASSGRLRIVSAQGDPPCQVTVDLVCRTAVDAQYPSRTQPSTRARIDLPARYPLQPPQVYLTPVVFHPNVYPSGLVCLGRKWMPTETLDLLVRRVAQIITFDPNVVNASSPASSRAADWYRRAVVRSPRAFPSDNIPFASAPRPSAPATWRDISPLRHGRAADEPTAFAETPSPPGASGPPFGASAWTRREPAGTTSPPPPGESRSAKIVTCSACQRQLRIPDAAGTRVRCPACRHVFVVAA
jgi:hypothetical protein